MTTRQELQGGERANLPEDLYQDALALLSRLTGENSASADPPALYRMAEILAGELRARGLAVEIRLEPDEHGVLLPVVDACNPPGDAPRGTEDGAFPLLLIGHFDTVLPASTPHLEGNRLVASGAIDMKGGIVVFLKALDLVARRGRHLPELRLVLVPDEEVGGAISRRAVATGGARAKALWVLEPGERTATGETVVTGRRGMFHWRLGVDGRSAHSGIGFWQGRSAVVAAAAWVERAAALSRPQGGVTVNIARLVAGERTFVDHLESAAALLGTARLLNVVPDRAVAEGEARFLRSGEDDRLGQDLAALAREIADRHEVAIAFTREASIPPVDPGSLPRAQADQAVDLAARAGWVLSCEADRGGISFPNFLAEPGRIPVLDGLGPAGGGMHTRAEYVDLDSLARRIRLLADLLQAEADLPDLPVTG